jgi:polyferredoxin
MANCSVCGSRFAEKKCYFCQNKICTSCITPPDVTGSTMTVKCIQCHRNKINKISFAAVIKRNVWILGIIAAFWIFMVFPIPFMHAFGYNADLTVFQPVIIATAIMTIPFVFMLFAWQRRAPRAD